MIAGPWDYLLLTASNESQAAAYRAQLEVRRRLGLLGQVREALVVPDPEGRRVGSGGSTICCLLEVLNRRLGGQHEELRHPEAWRNVLQGLRVLIIHAGGDSRRLPTYGPCGKVFVPLPGLSDSALGATLFDRQLPVYLRLPPTETGAGQIVITSGDVLLGFAPEEVSFAAEGVTGLGCEAAPEEASRHGVYCVGPGGQVRRFLQKPSPAEQAAHGAVDPYGHAVLDIGVIHFDAAVAVQLLELCEVHPDATDRLTWTGPLGEAIRRHGLDFYREICCALGTEGTLPAYHAALRASGSAWDEATSEQVFAAVSALRCRVQVLGRCDFLHFGTIPQLLSGGRELVRRAGSFPAPPSYLAINSRLSDPHLVTGADAWVEGCSITAALHLPGNNVVAGVDVDQPRQLPPGACLDVIPGWNRSREPVFFVRCYRGEDFADPAPGSPATLCGWPLDRWLAASGAGPGEIWDEAIPPEARSVWNARLFPAETAAAGYDHWLWTLDPAAAPPEHFAGWRQADRYSMEEMAALADHEAFHRRRFENRSVEVLGSLRRYFRADSGFSAADLAHLLAHAGDPDAWLADVLAEARRHWERASVEAAEEAFVFSRIVHSLGSAVLAWAQDPGVRLGKLFPGLEQGMAPPLTEWLAQWRLPFEPDTTVGPWADRARALAFEFLRGRIVASGEARGEEPANALRSDEIVWGRAPARLDLTGGWTDTPPFSLEHGGCVLNAAVELNGQPPIQVYARVTPEPVIRCRSIDVGTHLEIRRWDDLLNYADATSDFSLVKAALAISGFSPRGGDPAERTLEQMLQAFGGGLEVTTLAAIPKGSGLGTSSIMGAVLLAVIHRVLGRPLSPDALFHAVLRLEQALTTGGGWQDQIGGSVGGLKLITTRPGMVPQAAIRYVPADVLDPESNGGQTLLYYTGITRLAKSILEEVVGRYLERDREAVATLGHLQSLAEEMTEAVARKDLPAFGRMVATAWELNKRMDPHSTTGEIESLLARLSPHIYGAKLLGAGGGGFLLLVCRSEEDAAAVRDLLGSDPPNPRARFFDFSVANTGLAVSVC